MSFYDISTNPQDFDVQSPEKILSGKIQMLQNEFYAPDPYNIQSAVSVNWTADQLINNCVIRSGTFGGGVTDNLPSASSIVTAINNKMTKLTGREFVCSPGFHFYITVVNQGTDLLDFNLGAGCNGTFSSVDSNEARVTSIIVVNASSGSEIVMFDSL
jgi:hypothetical protein